MRSADLLSPEQRASFGDYAIRYWSYLAPGPILHYEAERVIYVRDRADAEALIAALNAEAAAIREREDAYFLWRCGIIPGSERTSA